MQFVIEDVLQAPPAWRSMPAFAEIDAPIARAVLEEAGKFAAGVLAPINGKADLDGCTWRDCGVTTPAGYREAYAAFIEQGWAALACDPEDGGQGLPAMLNAAFNEMIAAANHGWTMYPGLLHGAYECLRAHGSSELKQRYLTKLASGEWLATMNLTEPQAGSDLALVRSKADPRPDGSYRLTGSKIFISGGEHDLTDNIVHFVLARLPDAPSGTKGISLFLAPKVLSDGSRNAIRCDGIEKKMGIKGSATCAMNFDGATGWLLGEPNRGLAAMFVMMNSARLQVGLQGLGHLEAAHQNARAYALERVQGRGQPLAAHPAIRHILWHLRAQVDAGRVLAYWCAALIDESHHDQDAACRQAADARVGLLTPVVKAFLTDLGHRGADDALQVWGGYGYVHEYGIEQTVRDSRIAMIYEGTNEVQAIDLLQRKVLADGGAQLQTLLSMLDTDVNAMPAALADLAAALRAQTVAARKATQALIAGQMADPEWPLRVADDYLRALGLTLFGWAWCRIARAAAAVTDDDWCADALSAARYGIEWLLPEATWRWQRISRREAVLQSIASQRKI
ncbi:acyl-CoA dehydrogenase [Variovorax sp. V213]|uniref:acyl-CoA dehydrogenase n=1 Tax=Variovorax sp. V213 TaxID=3065955 RepID=UPI0034E88935